MKEVAFGVVLAVVLISVVTILGVLQIMRVYYQSHRALAEYAQIAQKPVFTVLDSTSSGDRIVFTLQNTGPISTLVR